MDSDGRCANHLDLAKCLKRTAKNQRNVSSGGLCAHRDLERGASKMRGDGNFLPNAHKTKQQLFGIQGRDTYIVRHFGWLKRILFRFKGEDDIET